MSVENGDLMKKQCKRCNEERSVSQISSVLLWFVCDECRKDDSNWDFNKRRVGSIPITAEAMERNLVVENILNDPEDDSADRDDNSAIPSNLHFKVEMSESIVPAAHKGHNVLGDYCWNCQIRTSNKVFGWTNSSNYKQGHRVRWADGTTDNSDKCAECLRHDCKYPVHTDHYKEKAVRDI